MPEKIIEDPPPATLEERQSIDAPPFYDWVRKHILRIKG
jgi:hypothetical protein